MRLRDQAIGAMNLLLVRPGALSEQDLTHGRAVADIATMGLLQERAPSRSKSFSPNSCRALNSRVVIEQARGMLAERDGLPTGTAFTAIRAHACHTGQALLTSATQVIDGSLDTEKTDPWRGAS